ncbi:MAG TPA: hypothetical protein VK524_24405, partial [Polyangiaceae bacterium]|nr:hypothetical protein [Polyangiaceae bacterium]
LASPERAADAWIEAVAADPSSEEAKASLREHAASTRDPAPLVEAFIRVGLAEESAALADRVACLRELFVLAEQRLADPGLALWAVRTLVRLSSEDEESRQALRRLVPRARLQDEALTEARAALQTLHGPARSACLRRAATILQGRPDRVDEYVPILRELLEHAPDERVWPATLARVLSRYGRVSDIIAELGPVAERTEGAESERHALALAAAKRRSGDDAGALAALRPFLAGARAHPTAHSFILLLATRLSDDPARSEALLRLAVPLAPPLRAMLASVAAELCLATGNVAEAREAAELACAADPSAARPIAVRAEIALREAAGTSVQELERAMAVLIPRAALCDALCEAYVTLENPGLALAFGQRELSLCPASEARLRRFLARVTALGDAAKLADALVWLMSQSQPLKGVAVELVQALRALSAFDRSRALAVARRVLDVLGPNLGEVRQALLEVADSLAEPALALSVLERWLATGAAGAVRAEVLLELFERRLAVGDADGALRTLCRALTDGAAPDRILLALARVPGPQSSDGELSALEARAEALALAPIAEPATTARALRELGAARWDLCSDYAGAVRLWERAAALVPEQGPACFAADLLAFAGPVAAVKLLVEWAERTREPSGTALAYALAAGIALEAAKGRLALALAARSLELDPRRADALAVAERAATSDDTEQLAQIYERVANAALGRYGERAANYRAARQLERRGDAPRALGRAIRAFEAVPSEGAAYVLMTRLSERTAQSADVVLSLERVAAQCRDTQVRAAWLRRAALFADASEEGRRLRVDVLLRALSVRADLQTLRALGEAFTALVELMPEDKEIVEMRFARALSSVLPGFDGPEGARMAVESARVALVAFDSAELAVQALTQATNADGSIDEFSMLLPYASRLANAPESARAFVTKSVELAGNRFSNLGRACLEFVAALAAEFDDEGARARLLVHAARQDPEDRELVRRAERALRNAGDPELEALLLEAVPAHERVLHLLDRARSADAAEDRAGAYAALEQALAGPDLAGEPRERVFKELSEIYAQAGRRDELERLLTAELERPFGEPAERVQTLRDLAALIAARGEPERALSLLSEAANERAFDELLLGDIVTLARQTGAKRPLSEALSRLIDSTDERTQKAGALRELAPLLEELGDSLAAISRWSELSRLDPGDAEALSALERDAEARGDYDELSRILGLRADQAAQLDDVRRIRLRRAMVLEQRLGRADEARQELEALLVSTGDALSVLRVLADLNE